MKTCKKSPQTITMSAVASILTTFFLFANLLAKVTSFSSQHGVLTSARISSLHMKGGSDFLSKLNPFSGEDSTDGRSVDSSSGEDASGSLDLAGEALIAKAKAVIAADLAIQDPSLLDEDFIWIGPFLDKPLGKVDYLASGRFFSLRTAFPDLDYRAHDFRLDANDPLTVRCTVRPQGVMRGPLRLRTEVAQPNGNRLVGPPEAISLTFDPKSGKVVKLCSGFALDRLVGNTNGLCGAMAAAAVAGVPPSDWEVYPIPTVISRFFGRPDDPVEEVSTFLAPFPETVMIQLAKGVLATNLAANDPSLLAKDFSFITPSVGPIGRNRFLESYALQEFGDYEPELSNFRVDPFDPYRVWVDVKLVGPGLEGPPQAFSFTIDDNGFCTRLTAGAVMDPSIGNTGGLTGLAGIKYALGAGDLDFTVRPFKVALGRLKKTVLSPFTNLSADDYLLQGSMKSKANEPKLRQSTAARTDEAPQGQGTEGDGTTQAPLQVEQESMPTLFMDEEEGRQVESRNDPELKEDFPSLKTLSEFTSSWPPKIASDLKLPSPPTIAPEVKLPLPPKIPPEFKLPSPPKVPPSPPLFQRPSLPKTAPGIPNAAISKDGVTASFFADAFKAFSQADVSSKRRPNETGQARVDSDGKKIKLEEEQRTRDQERKKAEEDRKAELERKKAAAAEAQAKRDTEARYVLKKQEEQQRKLELERKRALADRKAELEMTKNIAAEAQAKRDTEAKLRIKTREEEQRKRDQERKKAEEDRKAETERRKAVAAEALAKRDLEAKSAMKKREEEQRRKRDQESKEAEDRRQAELKRTKDAEAKYTSERRKQEAEAARLKAERNRKEASSPQPSSGRPSFQIPIFGNSGNPAMQKTVSSTSNPPKPRPSFQISLLNKASVANPTRNAEEKPTKGPTMPRPTFQLPKFGSASEEKPTVSSMSGRPTVSIPKAVKAPNGVPSIAAWQKRPNGVVTGQIFGSPNFKDGERVETSPIAFGNFANGSVVTTASGSKYFLSGQTPRELLSASTPRQEAPSIPKPAPRPSLKVQVVPKAPAKSPRKSPPETAKRPTFSLSALMGGSNEMKPTPKGTAQQSGTRSVPKGAPKTATQPARVLPKKTAPKGIPTISRWKQNRDKTITGFITGSPAFQEGERITTSPITGGMVTTGEVIVTTTSGSRYFLS